MVRDGKVNVRAGLIGFEVGRQWFRCRGGIRVRNVKGQTIRKHARGPSQRKVATAQHLLVDAQFLKAPRTEVQSLQPELEHAFQKTVARLQMLRSEKGSLRPDDRLQLTHGLPLNLAGAVGEVKRDSGVQ